MNAIKVLISLFALSLLAILTFSLSKSWFFIDRGISLAKEDVSKEEQIEKDPITSDELEKDARVIWKNYVYYPLELSKEEGNIGFDKVLQHAKNLVFINLNTGKLHKVFEKKVYIYDFFPGDFSKKEVVSYEREALQNGIDIGNKFIILLMSEDTNKDGYLNYKDKARVFVYDPMDEKLIDILPENYYFEKLLLNTRKNILCMIVRKLADKRSKQIRSQIFIYDSTTEKGLLVEDPDQ